MSEVKIVISNLDQIKAALAKEPVLMVKNLDIAIRSIIFLIRAKAVANAPVKTAYLRGSVYNDFSPLRGEVGFKAKYASWVHDGTSPYTIYPSSKKALFWKGASHPVRRVKHPGIRANPFLRKAVDQSASSIDQLFTKAVSDTLDTVARESR